MATNNTNDPLQVAPGSFTSAQLARIEDVMNATVREAVFVTEHLDSGDAQAAMDSLIQIRFNAEATLEKIEKHLGRLARRSTPPAPKEL